jgi:hypothetical protein
MVVANMIQDDISDITHIFILKGNVINEKFITGKIKTHVYPKKNSPF